MGADHRVFESADGIFQNDWRGSGQGAGVPSAVSDATANRLAGRTSAKPPSLYLGARRVSVAQERQRAREVVAIAKTRLANSFDDVRFGKSLNVDQLWPMVSGISASVGRHQAALISVTRLRERHEHTYLHSIAVCGLMIGLARQMRIDPGLHQEIGMAGLLHDVGKARVPTMLLDKAGALTLAEKDMVSRHTLWGYETLMRPNDGIGEANRVSDIVIDVCLHHHERIDGSGYPEGESGEGLSIPARMAAICDAYDSATTVRFDRPALSPAEMLELMANQPDRFDAQIVRHFTAMIGIFPVGSLVRLQSNRLAVVLDDPENELDVPPVCPFFCVDTQQSLPWRRSAPGLDPILGMELPTRWPLVRWADTRSAILEQFDPAKFTL